MNRAESTKKARIDESKQALVIQLIDRGNVQDQTRTTYQDQRRKAATSRKVSEPRAVGIEPGQ